MDPLTTRVKKKKKKKKNTLPRIYIDFLDARNRNFVFRAVTRVEESFFFVSSFKLRFSSQLDRSFVSLRNQTLRRPVSVWAGQTMRESQRVSNSRILEF